MDNKLFGFLALSALLAISGCKDDTADDGETPSDTDIICKSGTSTTFPEPGATGIYYRSTFAFTFISDENTTASFVLTDSAGAEVPLGDMSWSDAGTDVYFQAASPLESDSDYVLTATYSCDKVLPIDFKTSITGSVVDSADFVGKKYLVSLEGAKILEPAGVGELLAGFLEEVTEVIAIVPTAYNDVDDTIAFYGGLAVPMGDTFEQDVCTETFAFDEPATYSTDPYWVIDAPNGIVLNIEGVTIEIEALLLSGSFTPGGEGLEGVSIDGSLDARGLADILDMGAQEACDLLGTFGAECIACPDGEVLCLDFVATNLTAPAADIDYNPIATADVDANAECDM